jgi:hypothetical protein
MVHPGLAFEEAPNEDRDNLRLQVSVAQTISHSISAVKVRASDKFLKI